MQEFNRWMAVAVVDRWGEQEEIMATAVAWLWNAIAKPSDGNGITAKDVMTDWLADAKQ